MTGTLFLFRSPSDIGGLYNVKDVSYGAVGNGVADDTAAINAAVTASAGKGVIFFPKGTYKVTSAIPIPSGSSLIFTGVGDGSVITAGFNGFIFDNLTSPYTPGNLSVIEQLSIANTYTGNNFSVTGNGTWSASGSPVTITLSGVNPGVAAGGALWISDSRFDTNSVFVGMITSVASWPDVTVSSTAVASGATSNLAMRVVQCYAAGGSFNGPTSGTPTINSYTYNSGTGLVTLTMALATTLSANNPINVSGLNIAGLNGDFVTAAAVSASTTVTYTAATGLAGSPSGGGSSVLYGAGQITMASSRPTGIGTGQYYVYDYDYVLSDPKHNVNLGVATWNGTTLTFTTGSHGSTLPSIGSTDRLWLAPVAGCVRYSSVVGATVRDCTISGFIGITSSEDKIVASDPTLGAAQGFEITVERCNITNTSGFSALLGQTGIYLQNNSMMYYNSFNSCWCAMRVSGGAVSILGGRAEVNYFAILINGDNTATINQNSDTLISSISMESNLYAIHVVSGGTTNINGVGVLCNVIHQPTGGMYGIYINAMANSVIQNSAFSGNFGTSGYGVYIADAGAERQNLALIGVTAANSDAPSQGWRTPAQAWWGTCVQCNNPALTYTYANLPDGSGSPTPVEGETYDLSDCSTSTFIATAAGGGSGAAAHRRVRWNAVSSLWQVIG